MDFEGFTSAAFAWFAGLERDNSRGYFTATRDTYEHEVRDALEAMLEELAGEFGGDVRMFRQNRDVRFSPDKSPYKTTTYGLLQGRPPDSEAGLYAQVSARGLFAGTGYHVFARDQLDRFREAILDDAAGDALHRAVEDLEARGFEVYGEELKTAPRGFPRDHPRGRLLRHKAVFGGRALPAPKRGGIPRDVALEHVATTWRDGQALTRWLDAHVGPSTVAPEVRFGRR